jgi:hypothetical protein
MYFNASDLQMDSASESSALAATVDMLYGIITDIMLQAAHEQYWKCILSRVSPKVNERKKILIDEDHMRCDEDPNSPIIKDEDMDENFMDKAKKIVTQHRASKKKQEVITDPAPLQNTIQPQLGVTEITGDKLFT